MTQFSSKNFGLSDSLIDAARTVAEGKARFRVSGKEGTAAAKYLQDAETTLFARDEKDAAKKAIGDFKMKGVSINDLYVTREGFEYSDKKDLNEKRGDEYVIVNEESIQEAMQDAEFESGDRVRVRKDVSNKQLKKFAGKEGTVVGHSFGAFYNVRIKGARHGSIEISAGEMERI